jgi:hypothetical protein
MREFPFLILFGMVVTEMVTPSLIHSNESKGSLQLVSQSLIFSISGDLRWSWQLDVLLSSFSFPLSIYSKDFLISERVSSSQAFDFILKPAPSSRASIISLPCIDSCSSLNANIFISDEGSVWIQSAGKRKMLWEQKGESSLIAVTCHTLSISLWTTDQEMFIWTEETATTDTPHGSEVPLVTEVVILSSSIRVMSPIPRTSLFLSMTPSGDLVCLSDLHLCDSASLSRIPALSLTSQPPSLFQRLRPLRRTSMATSLSRPFAALPLIITLALIMGCLVIVLLYRCWSYSQSSSLHSSHSRLERQTGGTADLERGSGATEGMLYDTYPDHDHEEGRVGEEEERPNQSDCSGVRKLSLFASQLRTEEKGQTTAPAQDRRPYRHTAVNPLASQATGASLPPPSSSSLTLLHFCRHRDPPRKLLSFQSAIPRLRLLRCLSSWGPRQRGDDPRGCAPPDLPSSTLLPIFALSELRWRVQLQRFESRWRGRGRGRERGCCPEVQAMQSQVHLLRPQRVRVSRDLSPPCGR